MNSALIVSVTQKSTDFFMDMLREAAVTHIASACSCGEARRLLLERAFDLLIVNAPLRDESGEGLARYAAVQGGAQVILVVPSEHYDAVSAVCENDGVLTIEKPIHRAVFWSSLKLVQAAQNRFNRIQDENSRLRQKIEDIRIVDRAKCILISCLHMSEQEAHRHIEKQAMDMRTSKRAIAESVLRIYEN